MATDDPTGQRDDLDWQALNLPAELLPAAMAAFGTPERGHQWIDLLNRVAATPPRVRLGPDQTAYWRTEEYLYAIAESALEPVDYQGWIDAGLSVVELPRQLTALMQAGIGPAELIRCRAAGLTGRYLPLVLEYLDFETAIRVLEQWNGPRKPAARQLLSLCKSYGWTADRFIAAMATGLGGSDIYDWRKSTFPSDEWASWVAHRIGPATANIYRSKGLSAEVAGTWANSGLDVGDVIRALNLGLPLRDALDMVKSGVQLHQVQRTGAGWVVTRDEEPEPEPGPWDDDPVDQLPAVITPGQYHLTLWAHDFDGEHEAHDFWFIWNGERAITWSEDTSASYGFPGWSSAPMTGTAAWPDGLHVEVSFGSPGLGIEHTEELLTGAAPTSDHPTSDEGMRDPKQWVRLARALFEIAQCAMRD